MKNYKFRHYFLSNCATCEIYLKSYQATVMARSVNSVQLSKYSNESYGIRDIKITLG